MASIPVPSQRPGRFRDGRTGRVRAVTVRSSARGLDIREDHDLLVAFWRTADLLPLGEDADGVRVGCAADPASSLTIATRDATVVPPAMKPRRARWRLGLAVAVVAVAASWVMTRPPATVLPPPVPSGEGANRCHGPAGKEALARLGARLGLGAVEVEDDAAVAVELNGRVMTLSAGALLAAGNGDRLALMMAEALAQAEAGQGTQPAATALLHRAGLNAPGETSRPPALREAEWQAVAGMCRSGGK